MLDAIRSHINNRIKRHAVDLLLCLIIFWAVLYFYQGGGWNQNAHFSTVVALVEDHSFSLEKYVDSTGDLAYAEEGYRTSAKALGTAIMAVPAYLVSKLISKGISNRGNQIIIQSYLTSCFSTGLAWILVVLAVYHFLIRLLNRYDACILSLALGLATPLLPNSTMLNSHAWVALFAFLAFTQAMRIQANQSELSPGTVIFFGVLVALPTAFEYLCGLLLIPFCSFVFLYIRPRRYWLLFVLGILVVFILPALHHSLVYGMPWRTGYSSMVKFGMAKNATLGFFGISSFSFRNLYELTFGAARGFFFLSPFLLAGIPGSIRWLKDPQHRAAAGLLLGSGGLLLLTVASLNYWHSGSATGSRYALIFVVYMIPPIAALFTEYRYWILGAIGVSFCFMLMATAVTALPPPLKEPPYYNVLSWWYERFVVGNIASWQQAPLTITGMGDGQPTMPFSFNLGQLIGLSGVASLIPYLLVQVFLVNSLLHFVRVRKQTYSVN